MGVPCTAQEILENIEEINSWAFMNKEVPELYFWSVGLEYIDSDTVEVRFV